MRTDEKTFVEIADLCKTVPWSKLACHLQLGGVKTPRTQPLEATEQLCHGSSPNTLMGINNIGQVFWMIIPVQKLEETLGWTSFSHLSHPEGFWWVNVTSLEI